MQYVLKTDNSNLLVSVVDMKAYLLVDFSTDDDLLITSLIKTATKYVENYTHRDLLSKTYTLYLDCFSNYQRILRHKVQSISSVKYYLDGVLTTYSATNYGFTKSDNDWQQIYLKNNDIFPETDDNPQSIEIEFIAGFGSTEASVPEDYKIMCKRLVSYLYNHRGDCLNVNIDLSHSSLTGLKSLLDMNQILVLE